MMIDNKPEEWGEMFDKQLTERFAGDSGIGGNVPQEPVYEISCSPNDVKSFIRTHFISKSQLKSVIEGMRCDERKVGVFCKMEARTYYEKELVNAVLSDLATRLGLLNI